MDVITNEVSCSQVCSHLSILLGKIQKGCSGRVCRAYVGPIKKGVPVTIKIVGEVAKSLYLNR